MNLLLQILIRKVRCAVYRKEILYDKETRGFQMWLDGELVGFARTYHEAEVTLDQLVFELMTGNFYVKDQSDDNDHTSA